MSPKKQLQVKKAAKQGKAPVPTNQDLPAMGWEMDLIEDEAIPAPRDQIMDRMDNMMAMINKDLAKKVNGSDNHPPHPEGATQPPRMPGKRRDGTHLQLSSWRF